MDPVEVERRKRWYFGESEHSRLCALAILPAKKRFAIFPESLAEAMSSSRGDDVVPENFSRVSGESLANGSGVKGSDRNKQLMDTIMGSFGFEDDTAAGLEEEEEEEEMERGLRVWMERLEDGSLKRYSTDSWPLWQ